MTLFVKGCNNMWTENVETVLISSYLELMMRRGQTDGMIKGTGSGEAGRQDREAERGWQLSEEGLSLPDIQSDSEATWRFTYQRERISGGLTRRKYLPVSGEDEGKPWD
ncbi:Calcium-dependent secretion activator [Dissostichus eleginoides]|uniref:Calcium-dependent secretion activator n=1 Tax=Dissostichus eleginoides TaxID=100907 RepID=A0AAD9CSF7_DISEL|nr:Calcium-dependent secretion activator [Dissostichus eleginoides]